MENFVERLRNYRKLQGLTLKDMADKLGCRSVGFLSEVEREKKKPGSDLIFAFEKLVSAEGVVQGEVEGKRALSRGKVPAEGEAKLLPLDPGDVVALQVYVTGGAGAPYEFIPSEPIEEIIVPKTYYTRTIVPVKVRGRSMEKTLRDGAVVGVDRADRQIVNGELYAVWLPYQGTVIKRLYINTERIQLHSDNEEFRNEDIAIALDKVDDNFIQGRVKWVIQLL